MKRSRKMRKFGLASIAMLFQFWLVHAPTRANQIAPDAADLIAALQPAVVNLSIVAYVRTKPFEGNISSQANIAERRLQSSGFFVDPSGILVTNSHVVVGANEIVVTLQDTTRLRAYVLATAAQSDIALLRINPSRPVPTVKFGDSDRLHPGDPVFVIGNPFGLVSTVTSGIVSALDRNTVESQFSSFFQIDAALNRGNSGGPVFNKDGELVGVATALFAPGNEGGSVGLGLAIPSNDVRFILQRLLDQGRVQLAWIGVHVQPVTSDIAAAVGLPSAVGSIVIGVESGSPAARAGLSDGDIIFKVGGDAVPNPRSLNRKLAGTAIGRVVALAIWREGNEQTVLATIEESQTDTEMSRSAVSLSAQAVHTPRGDLGLILGPITQDDRAKLGIPLQQTGAIVEDVVPNSEAADQGVSAGSLIVNVDRHPVSGPADVQRYIDMARKEYQKFVLVLTQDPQGRHWVALPLDFRS